MKKLLLAAIGLLLAQFCLTAPAHAVACSGTSVHGSGNHACYAISPGTWSTTTVWSATSGGGSCGCTIATGDELIFDANTPAGTYGNTAISLASLDAINAPANVVISGNNAVTISGLFFALSPAMTYTAGTNGFTFTSTTGTTIVKTGGHTITTLIFNGSGGTFTIGGDAANNIITTAAFTVTLGTLDGTTNNPAVTVGALTQGGGVLNCGTGLYTMTGVNASPLNITGGTTSCASASFAVTQTTPTGVRTLATNGQSFGAFTINGPASVANSYQVPITGNATFASLTLNGPLQIIMSSGATYTISTTPTWTGTSANPILLVGGQTQSTINVPASPAPAFQWLSIANTTFTGNTAGVCTNCFNGGHDIGITISGPTAGGGIIGG